MCNCIHVNFGTYENIITLDNPFYPKNSTKRLVDIDNCIVDEIKNLWDEDIQTIASCCGHNKQDAIITVISEDFDKMVDLGYVVCEDYNNTFYAKSVSRVGR